MYIPYVLDIQRLSLHDGPGLRTKVIFQGCDLNCLLPQNSQDHFQKQILYLYKKKGKIVKQYTVEMLVKYLQRDQFLFSQSGGGVTLAGEDALNHNINYLNALAKALQDAGISICIEIWGHVPNESIALILPYTDMFLYDLKSIGDIKPEQLSDEGYTIFDNLKYLSNHGKRIVLRLLSTKNANADEQSVNYILNLLRLKHILVECVTLLPYHEFDRDINMTITK